jgi:thiamine pyrophosphate-dependent acetolactate synthase large subunit-like protein
MDATEAITGAEWLARALAANGTTHVFFIDAVLRRTLVELGALGVTRVLAHAEKSAAYMADGYARIAGRPGICFAQSVGAANLAAGLQDAYLGHSPVIALTGRRVVGRRKDRPGADKRRVHIHSTDRSPISAEAATVEYTSAFAPPASIGF